MNYTELQTNVADWLNRSDAATLAVIPVFIDLAEARLQRLLESKHTTTYPVNIGAGDSSLPLPADLIDIRSVTLTTATKQHALHIVAYSAVETFRQRYPLPGVPLFGAVVGTTLHFAPVSDGAYAFAIEAQERFVSLRSAATNWILDHHPDAYLFGALVESAPYLKDDERIGTWEGRFQIAVSEIAAARDRTLWPAQLVRPLPPTFAF